MHGLDELLVTTRFLCLALFLQGMEMLVLASKQTVASIWSFENLKEDFKNAIPLPLTSLRLLFSIHSLRCVSGIQLILTALAAWAPQWSLILLLFFTHLYICIRFRGTFNGGSDMMTFVVLTGVLVGWLGFIKAGAIYITIHLIYSYTKAGFAKARRKEWWDGRALPIFLSRSVLLNTHSFAEWLSRRPLISRLAGWFVIFFELSFTMIVFFPKLNNYFLFAAMGFHFFIYLTFGLNRFFWIWLAAWQFSFFALNG